MSLTPLLTAPMDVLIHALSATIAILVGPMALYRKRRDLWHRISGYIWVLAMVLAAISSFWITTFAMIGPFSPLHSLSLLALWSLFTGMRAVFAGRYSEHALIMRNLYWRGLMIAGIFQFLPGRTLNRMLMDDARQLGYVVIALGIGAIVYGIRREVVRNNRTVASLFA